MVGGSRIGSIYNSEKLTWMSCGIDRPAQVIMRPRDGRTGQKKTSPTSRTRILIFWVVMLGGLYPIKRK